MALVQEFKLFEVCLYSDKKQIMIKALDRFITRFSSTENEITRSPMTKRRNRKDEGVLK